MGGQKEGVPSPARIPGYRTRQQKTPGVHQDSGGVEKIRQHLLSHLQYYHRLRKLNYRVRDGNGCGLSDMVAGKGRGGRVSGPCARLWSSGEPLGRRRIAFGVGLSSSAPFGRCAGLDCPGGGGKLMDGALDTCGQAFAR